MRALLEYLVRSGVVCTVGGHSWEFPSTKYEYRTVITTAFVCSRCGQTFPAQVKETRNKVKVPKYRSLRPYEKNRYLSLDNEKREMDVINQLRAHSQSQIKVSKTKTGYVVSGPPNENITSLLLDFTFKCFQQGSFYYSTRDVNHTYPSIPKNWLIKFDLGQLTWVIEPQGQLNRDLNDILPMFEGIENWPSAHNGYQFVLTLIRTNGVYGHNEPLDPEMQ